MFDVLFAPLVVGTATLFTLSLIAWGIFLGIIAFMIIMSENEMPEFAAMLFVIWGVAYWVFTGNNVALMAWNNWPYVLIGVVEYIAAGVLWSFFRWDRFAANAAKEFQKLKDTVSAPEKLVPKDYIPIALDHQHKFLTWIVLWWASMFWYFCSEFIEELVEFIVRHFGKIYDAIAQRHFKGL